MNQYFAGLFDGEGCVGCYKYRRKYVQARVQIRMIDPRPLRLFQAEFGGALRSYKFASGGRRSFDWHLEGKAKIQHFLTAISPYSIVKKDEIVLALRLLGLIRNVGGGGVASQTYEATAVEREEIFHRMRALKRREFPPLSSVEL